MPHSRSRLRSPAVSCTTNVCAVRRGRRATFTLEHYAKVARVSDVRIAPAGDRAVMVVAWPNYEANAWESEIVLVDLRTGRSAR